MRVGLEPVAVAARTNRFVWVVNHLSDSVSVVDVLAKPPRVIRTLLVGDEPRDIVFAGKNGIRAFITAAHRGQNVPFDPQSFTAGVGRADVWVFNGSRPGAEFGGTPITILSLFGDTLRPLAVSPDGARVYAGVFNSGNRSTVLQADIGNGGLDKPGPAADALGNTAPRTGLIVRFQGGKWIDNGDPENGEPPRDWSERVRFSLPDNDVFEIDALASPPTEVPALLRRRHHPVQHGRESRQRQPLRLEHPGAQPRALRRAGQCLDHGARSLRAVQYLGADTRRWSEHAPPEPAYPQL